MLIGKLCASVIKIGSNVTDFKAHTNQQDQPELAKP